MRAVRIRYMGPWLTLLGAAVLGGAPAAGRSEALGADTGIDWRLSAEQVTNACHSALASARASVRAIESAPQVPASFEAGLGAIEAVNADLNDALVAPTELVSLSPERAVRDASQHCVDEAGAFGVELTSSPALLGLAEAAAGLAASDEQRQLAKIYIEATRRTGAGLPEGERAKVQQLFDALNKLQAEYNRALSEDKSEITLSDAEAQSLPAALAGALRRDGSGIHLAVNEGTYLTFMDNEVSPDARHRYLIAFRRLGGRHNVELLAQALGLRAELAQRLGYPSWAAYRLDVETAKTVQRALALVLDVNRRALPKARAELAELTALKRAAGDPTPLRSWDYGYYKNQMIKSRYAVDAELVRQYFPLDTVVPAVLGIYQRLLGVRFEALSPAAAWAPDVSEYAIYDTASGAPLGYFFLDLYPRDGKTAHISSATLRAGRLLGDGQYRLPVAAIFCNWPQPAAGKPTLLSHEDVINFFHEFGHVMHGTLSRTRYQSLFGPQVRQDFVEAPSQMLENWMWQPEVLRRVSGRVGNGEPLPDELIAKMVAAKHAGDGNVYAFQTFFGYYDLQLHSLKGPVDPDALYFTLERSHYVFPPMRETYPAAGLWHMVNGYDAGYYGYLWALVYAQDMFSRFQKEGIDNPAVGLAYRNDILVPGGSAEPDVLLHRFLGREVSTAPFYELIGLPAH